MNPGDIYLFPTRGNPSGDKDRFVLVLAVGQTGTAQDHVVVVAEIVSSGRCMTDPFVGDIRLDDWAEYGLTKPSLLRARKFWSAPPHLLTERIGQVTPDVSHAAWRTAMDVLEGGCSSG